MLPRQAIASYAKSFPLAFPCREALDMMAAMSTVFPYENLEAYHRDQPNAKLLVSAKPYNPFFMRGLASHSNPVPHLDAP
jgi:hypothetical protein